MAQQFTVWKREDSNTTPRGFGNPPTYSIDKPYTSDADMSWAEPIVCTLPDGHTIAEDNHGAMQLYDAKGLRTAIVDHCGRPAIVAQLGIKFARFVLIDAAKD